MHNFKRYFYFMCMNVGLHRCPDIILSIFISFLLFCFISFLLFSTLSFYFRVSCSPGFLQTHKVAENDLEYLILLPLPLECWDYMYVLLHPFLIFNVNWGLNQCPCACKARTLSTELYVQSLVSLCPWQNYKNKLVWSTSIWTRMAPNA